MLPTEILDNRTDKQTIATSAMIRIQVAFHEKITAFLASQPPASLALGHKDLSVSLNRLEVQQLAQAPHINIGQVGGVTDEEVEQLAAYLLKAFLGYFNAYAAANFSDPSKAALTAMHQFNLSF